ncbi:hypothetical protein LTR86_005496 [Recurvomyces mirabilis]|nr:hypothetical protein LTR86_005496 [Recurvomyces mirabilis]
MAHDEDAFLVDALVQRCKASVSKIVDVATSIENIISRHRTLGRIQMSYQAGNLRQLWETVEREKSSLALACQVHTAIALQAQARTQAMLMEDVSKLLALCGSKTAALSHPSAAVAPSSEVVAAVSSPSRASSHQLWAPTAVGPKYKHRKKDYWSFRIAPWFGHAVWQVALTRATTGWTLSLREWRVVSYAAEIFQMVHRGSVENVRRLIESGEASPLDVNEYGQNLIEIATQHYYDSDTTATIRYLLSVSPELRQLDSLYYIYANARHIPGLHSELVNTFGLDVQSIIESWVEGSRTSSESRFTRESIPLSLVRITKSSIHNFDALPLRFRFELALQLGSDCSPTDFLEVCMLDHITAELAGMTRLTDGASALMFAASAIARDCSWGPDVSTSVSWNTCWDKFVVELSWISIMEQAGVDLIEYGRKESELWELESRLADMVFWYGKTPSDWTLKTQLVGLEDWPNQVRPGDTCSVKIPLRCLEAMPGDFPVDSYRPTTIFWDPQMFEHVSGSWRKVGGIEVIWRLNPSAHEHEDQSWKHELDISRLILAAQDDAFQAVFRRDLRFPRHNARRCRRSSMPDKLTAASRYAFILGGWTYHKCIATGRRRADLCHPRGGYSDCFAEHMERPQEIPDAINDIVNGFRMDHLAGTLTVAPGFRSSHKPLVNGLSMGYSLLC